MAKYLYLASYTQEGLKGLLKDGGSKRKKDLSAAVKEMKGKADGRIIKEIVEKVLGEN